MPQINVSIILATYNWPEALDVILANLLPQLDEHPTVEIVIADDGSAISTTEVIRKYIAINSRIHHIWHPDNGFQKSMILNKAVAAARGDYLLFIDGDCIPFPDYITEQLKLLESGYFVAGNRVLLSKSYTEELLANPHKINQIFKWNILQWLMAKLAKKVNKLLPSLRLGNGRWRYSRSNNWKYPKGCNFAVSRADFLAINGFDEAFTGWGHEDADLFVRFLHNGIKIKDGRFAVPVLHLWHKNSDRCNEKENMQLLLNRLADEDFIRAEVGVSQYLKGSN
jgi:glycosyltransferase involved in cell wall biosynthesis